MAMKRLQSDCPHPRREPDHGLIVRDRAVPADLRQGLRLGDGPALEQQIAGFFLNEHRRAVVPACVRVDRDED
jgi:hypothetical protein